MWLPYTPEETARFGELAGLLNEARETFRDVASSTDWRAVPGSEASSDQETLAAREPALADGDEYLITQILHHFLYAAGELIGGVGALYAEHETLFAPTVLARSVVEHCAHVLWVYGKPGDSADERLARVFLEELASADMAKMNSGRLLGKDSDEYKARTKAFRTLKADVKKYFPAPTADDKGNPLLLGQQLPNPEKAFVQMYRSLNPGLTETVSRGTYGFLSNYTHPTAYPTRELFVVTNEGGRQTVRRRDDLEHHSRLIKAAISPFYAALAWVMRYHGWSGDRLNAFADRIEAAVPGHFVRKEVI